MISPHALQRSLALRVAVPLMLCFVVVGSVFFDYLAQDLTVEQISDTKDWHFLLISALLSVVLVLVWYIQLHNYLADLQAGKRANPPMAWVAWLGIVLQLLNFVVSVLFIIGAATTWFTAEGSTTDPIRIYTIVIGSFGIIAFGLSGGLGIWVQMSVRGIASRERRAGRRMGSSYPEASYGYEEVQPMSSRTLSYEGQDPYDANGPY